MKLGPFFSCALLAITGALDLGQPLLAANPDEEPRYQAGTDIHGVTRVINDDMTIQAAQTPFKEET